MKDDNAEKMALMKMEMQLALVTFKEKFKKASKGIIKIYENAILSNDFETVKKEYQRFFGYIQKSKRAKEKWQDEDDTI